MAGPKSLRNARVLWLRKGVCVVRLSPRANMNVPKARMTVRKALSRPYSGVTKALWMSLKASTIKIIEMRPAKISSVKRVKYFMRALASVKAQMSRKSPDQIPTQA